MVISISGKAGSGKDTFASIVCSALSTLNITPVRIAFADPMKKHISELFDVSPSYFTERSLKEEKIPGLNVSAREFMLAFNTFIESTYPNVFVDRAKDIITPIANDHSKIVIVTDARVSREFDYLNSISTHCVLIVRPGQKTSTAAKHHTETYIDTLPESYWNTVIHNCGSISDLEKQAWTFARAMSKASR